MAETPTGETINPEALENEVKPVATPVVNAPDPAELERLQKEQDKKDLRIRQLENEAAARDKAEETRKAKELESKEEFKTLYEQEKAAKEELAAEREAAEHLKNVNELAAGVLKDYTDEVEELAKDLGLNLADDSEEAVSDFKAKLDAVAKRVPVSKVTPNNPSVSDTTGKATGEALRGIMADPVKRDAYMREHYPVTASMMSTPPTV